MVLLVTGSNGRIGRYVVRELQLHGHSVVGLDLGTPISQDYTYIRADLTDAGQIYNVLARFGIEAVVHMGAWANAGLASDQRVYGDNVSGTFNLFQACADLGIRRIVSASSNQIYGFAGAPPLYVPVDEEHPARPVNCYALSKTAGEQAADYFVKQFGLEILSFRLLGVRTPEEIAPEIEAMVKDPASGNRLLWTRTDARDAAQACRLAIEASTVEPGPYNITSSETVLPQLTIDLVTEQFGNMMKVRGELPDHASPLSIAKARAAFGYEPKYVWRHNQYHPE